MKKLFLSTTVMLLTLVYAQAQIADVQQKGNNVYVFDKTGKQMSAKNLDSDYEVKGFSSTFFVVKKGNSVYTYDEKCNSIASISLDSGTESGYEITGVSGDTFNVKKGTTTYTYDKNCKQVSSRTL